MAREKYGYAETSTLRATIAGPIRSVVNDTLALENGMLQTIGDIKTNKEVYTAVLPKKEDKVVLIHSSLYAYDTSTTLGQHEMYLRKEIGEPARAYYIYEGDRFAVGDWMITPADEKVAKDNLVVADTSTGFYTELEKETDVSAYGFAAVIEEVEAKSNMTIVRLRVLQNDTVKAAAPGVGG